MTGQPAAAGQPVQLAERFHQRLHRNGRGHYKAAQSAIRKNRALGALTAILSATAGSALLASAKGASTALVVVAGAMGLVVSALAALQTVLRYSEVAAEHLQAGRDFAALRRELDVLLIKMQLDPTADPQDRLADLDALRRRWDQAANESPLIPPWADRKAARELAREDQDTR